MQQNLNVVVSHANGGFDKVAMTLQTLPRDGELLFVHSTLLPPAFRSATADAVHDDDGFYQFELVYTTHKVFPGGKHEIELNVKLVGEE